MSGTVDLSDVDPASAQEILRQAQAVVQAPSLSLATAGLGGAALSFGSQGSGTGLLPIWAGSGLAVAGLLFSVAAFGAAWALRPTNFAIAALRPGELLNAGYDRKPARQVYLALAFELDRGIPGNDRLGRNAAERFETALKVALIAPLCGACFAAGLALSANWRLVAGAVVVVVVFVGLGNLTAWAVRPPTRG